MKSNNFAEQCKENANYIGDMLEQKNKAYGDSINVAPDIIKILYPNGISPEQLDDSLVIVRVIDKLMRLTRGDKHAFDESPWKDIAGYAVLQYTKAQNECKK